MVYHFNGLAYNRLHAMSEINLGVIVVKNFRAMVVFEAAEHRGCNPERQPEWPHGSLAYDVAQEIPEH